MSKNLPARPSLDHLKKQAKELYHQSKTQGDASMKLADAQHAVAREYGLKNWAELKARVAALQAKLEPEPALLEEFKKAFDSEGAEGVAAFFRRNPAAKAFVDAPILAFDGPAIVVAAAHGSRQLVEVLLKAGADINAKSTWWAGGFGVLDQDNSELAAWLIARGARLDAYSAARHGMIEPLREFITADPQAVHMRGGDGQTPLHVARTVEVARLLLEHGADIDARDIDHESTPAQYMTTPERAEVARYLVSRGCQTDILMAAALGDAELVREHLDEDPQCIRMCVNEEFFPKRNPRAGGIIYIWTLGINRTVHQVAAKFGHPEIMRLLMERSPAELRLMNAFTTGDQVTVNELLPDHPDLLRELIAGYPTQIAKAAEDNNTAAVRLMLSSGWPVDPVGSATPLHWAAWHGNTEMVHAILAYNPPLENLDPLFHGPPMGWAAHGSLYGAHRTTGDYAGVAEALLNAGAKPPQRGDMSDAIRRVVQGHK